MKYLTFVDEGLGSDSRAVESFISFNAIISGISMLFGKSMNGMIPSTHVGLILAHWALVFGGSLLVTSFVTQITGCVFSLCGNHKYGFLFRQYASMLRLTTWCSLSLFMFIGVEGITRLEIRYVLFFAFEAWILMSLTYRR